MRKTFWWNDYKAAVKDAVDEICCVLNLPEGASLCDTKVLRYGRPESNNLPVVRFSFGASNLSCKKAAEAMLEKIVAEMEKFRQIMWEENLKVTLNPRGDGRYQFGITREVETGFEIGNWYASMEDEELIALGMGEEELNVAHFISAGWAVEQCS